MDASLTTMSVVLPLNTLTEQTKIFFLICFEPDSVTFYGWTPIYAWSHGFTYGPEGSHTEGHILHYFLGINELINCFRLV